MAKQNPIAGFQKPAEEQLKTFRGHPAWPVCRRQRQRFRQKHDGEECVLPELKAALKAKRGNNLELEWIRAVRG